MAGFNFENFIISFMVIVASISLHEFGHAISADRLGDPGPRRDGRITLWPGAHLDPFGTIMMIFTLLVGIGIGWGKPVMVNSRAFKNPRMGMVITSAFGPLMNLILAVFFGLILRFTLPLDWYGQDSLVFIFLYQFLVINLGLMFFNLIPIHPLDGGKILSGLMPLELSEKFDSVMWQWGPLILMIACFSGSGILGTIIRPAMEQTARLILGV